MRSSFSFRHWFVGNDASAGAISGLLTFDNGRKIVQTHPSTNSQPRHRKEACTRVHRSPLRRDGSPVAS